MEEKHGKSKYKDKSELRKLIVLKKDKVAYDFSDSHYQAPFTLLYADLQDLTKIINRITHLHMERAD
jgi:hypothetical protein